MAMRDIAESYIVRRYNKKRVVKSNASTKVPRVTLKGEKGKAYKPISVLGKGSGGIVFTAVRIHTGGPKLTKLFERGSEVKAHFKSLIRSQLNRQLALKQVFPSQKSSAENEYSIGLKLRKVDTKGCCVTYLDKAMSEEGSLWLLLRRVLSSSYGTDMAEYISSSFFQMDGHQAFACGIVLDLLDGLQVISNAGVCMRDVKPDNILIEEEEHKDRNGYTTRYVARWSDFGLGVHLHLKHIRAPNPSHRPLDKQHLRQSLVGFWYDTQVSIWWSNF